jgi:hypothetical protein
MLSMPPSSAIRALPAHKIAQTRGGNILERALKAANRRARGGGDDDRIGIRHGARAGGDSTTLVGYYNIT